jgi:hypothetical protein
MDKAVIKAAYDAICKEMRGRMGKMFEDDVPAEGEDDSTEPGIDEIMGGKGSDEEPGGELEQQSSDQEDGSPDPMAILEAAAKVARKK